MSENLVRSDRGTRDERRLELIDGAIQVIARYGLGGTTLTKVAAVAGLSAGIVNHHFETKEALLTETLKLLSEEFSAMLARAVGEAQSPQDGLKAIITLSFDPQVSAPEKVAVWYAFQSETHWRKSYMALCGERDAAYMGTLRNLMAALERDRFEVTQSCDTSKRESPSKLSIEPDRSRFNRSSDSTLNDQALTSPREVDAEMLARSFAGLLDSYWQDILFEGENFDRGGARRACLRFLATIFPAQASAFGESQAAVSEKSNVVALARADQGGGKTTKSAAGPATTLPSWTYRSPEFFALETEHIFMKEWHIVAHVNQLREIGAYQSFELLNERAFVIRGSDNVIRGFHNVCRHRAHEVVTGAHGQCRSSIICPYHGWAYELNGRLKGVAAPHSFAQIDKREFGLKPVETEIYQGFIFIRFGGDGPGVAERFAPYEAELKQYRFAELVPVDELSFQETGADWKNVWDNYLEGYHFTKGHPGLSGLMSAQYRLEARPAERVARLSHDLRTDATDTWSGKLYQKILERPAHLPEAMRESWSYFFMFPLLSFDVYPDMIGHFQVIPTAAGASMLRYQNYALPEQLDSRRGRAARWLNMRINGQVQLEDDHLVSSVQGGLRSSAYNTGVLSEKEVIVNHFQNWVRRAVPLAKVTAQPVAGTMAARNAAMVGQ